MILHFAEFLCSIVSNLLFLRLSTEIERQVEGTRNEQVTQLSRTFITTLMKSLGDVSCGTFGEIFRDKCPSRFASYRQCILRVCCLSKFGYRVKSIFDLLVALRRNKVDWFGDDQTQR